ncbi:PLC-like phosphodiesterase [Neohortaea acidophila]|uniref:PLC-like phosphodiesterase n=1 Tax=Neohortaea acidophila TaxID=245834 RepID=A0A6A6PX91_9PEZI|nr:PLC-like phosphodiesterase [Neohortaea acidophila]KAF2484319.1 PLC-like phosphodiesterase [Neohortaea acidophila]
MPSLAILSTLLALAVAFPLNNPPAPQTCNGDSRLCDRQYSNITFIGAHDSPFVGTPDNLAANQGLDLQAQLAAGIRFFSAQAHQNVLGQLDFCHTYCWEYDAGPVTDYLSTLASWLDANPNDVVTLLLVNGGFYDVSLYAAAFESTNLSQYAYAPNKTLQLDEWPTLAQMIKANTRLVALMDYGANTTTTPYILPEFSTYYFETPYDTTNPLFPECSINRPPGASAQGRMYGMNHFLDLDVLATGIDVPDNARDVETNAAEGPGSIGAQAEVCAGLYGRYPNFVLVDRVAVGEVFVAQERMNFAAGR